MKPAGLELFDDRGCLALAGADAPAAEAPGTPIGTVAVGMEMVGVPALGAGAPALGAGVAGRSGEDAGGAPREDVWAERGPPSPVVPIGWWVPALSEEPGAAQTKEEQGHLVRPDASEE